MNVENERVMVTVLRQGATKKSIHSILEQLAKGITPKGVDVYKYCGKIKLNKDALTIQKDLRNEWE